MEQRIEARCELAQSVKISGVLRRLFLPLPLISGLFVVALWAMVALNPGARRVAWQQVRTTLAPSPRDEETPTLPPNASVALQMADATIRRDTNVMRALVEAHPNDAALLGVFVRQDHVLPNFFNSRSGPLLSRHDNWSVQIAPNTTAPSGMAPPPPRYDMAQFQKLVARGQRLEPNNTYWDWMEMVALCVQGREREIDAVAHRAARKTLFDDHTLDEAHARTVYEERVLSSSPPTARLIGFMGLPLRHYSPISTVNSFLAQRVMGLRLEKRDALALALGMDSMRLGRLIRLQATNVNLSELGARCEQRAIQSAGVPLLRRLRRPPSATPVKILASDSESLLFLAKQSPGAAREIATEWKRLAGWKGGTFYATAGGLIAPRTLLGLGAMTQAALYLEVSLPVALVAWLILSWLSRRTRREGTLLVSPRLTLWGAGLGFFALVAVLIPLTGNMRPFVTHSDELWSWAFISSTFLLGSRFSWGAATLFLLWIALWRRASPRAPQTPRRIEDWEQSLAQSLPFRFIDWTWNVLKWGTRTFVPLAIGLCALGTASVSLLFWPDIDRGNALWNALAWLFLGLSLGVLPGLWVWLREARGWEQTRRRTGAPQLFVARARSFIGGFLVAALLVLPILLFAQSRFERDFNAQFAPIEEGQMLAAIQKMRGLPMQ